MSTSPAAPSVEPMDPDDRRKHLDFIQAVVTRMSAASTTTKSWLLPVVTATYGYATTNRVGSVAALGIAAVVLFAFLDANYLRQEKAYRRLYDAVARSTSKVPHFSLNPAHAADPANGPSAPAGRVSGALRSWVPELAVWRSWSVAPFYGSLFVIGVVIFIRAR